MDAYVKIIGFVGPLFLVMIAIELAVDWKRRAGHYRVNDAINSLSLGIMSTYTRPGLRLLMLIPYAWVVANVAPVKLPADHWATWLLAFILYDFMYYWLHRLSHEWNWLWAVHVVHHQSEEFNLTTALRQASLGPLVAWPFFLPLALVGIPWEVTGVVSVIQLVYQFWPHTRHVDRMGILDRWIQTPSNHRVHHAQNDRYLDRNYGGILMIWDRMFGTFQDELDEEPCLYGIRGQLKSWNPVWANFHVWWDLMQASWRTGRWSDKLRVWTAPPGWRPADVAERWPKKPYTLADFRLFDPPISKALRWYALCQFGFVYPAAVHYIKTIEHLPLDENVGYALAMTLWLVALDGLLEGRRRFIGLEVARILIFSIGATVAGGWFGGVTGAWVGFAATAYGALSLTGLAVASRIGEPVPERPQAAAIHGPAPGVAAQ